MNRIARVIAMLALVAAAGCAGAIASSAPSDSVAPPEAEPLSITATVSATVETTTTTAQALLAAMPTIAPPSPPADPGCYADLARAVGWPEHTLTRLQSIMWRESRCDPSAFADRPSTLDLSRGLLQINAYGYLDAGLRRLCGIDPVTLFDPAINLACGLELWRAMGWAPWGG